MAEKAYRTVPAETSNYPGGMPYIISNELAERFSYYGMRAILVVFMTQYLLDSTGGVAPMSNEDAKVTFHFFIMASYFFPFLGGILADWLWGKYRTIISLSLVYCAGHFVLAVDETRTGLFLGLGLIAIGAGGIKPCVSTHLGDQFGRANRHLLEKAYSWFYFSINLGSFVSILLTPLLLEHYGPWLAFGVPGILMALATFAFWLGRHEFVHIPPRGSDWLKGLFSTETRHALGRLAVLYLFIAAFWALYDQTGSSWVLQARDLDRHFLGIEWLPSQINAINPILILIFIPFTALWLYPMINRIFPLTPLRKIAIGLFLTVPAFALPAWIQMQVDAGATPNIVWQLLAFVLITLAEVFVSITALEFSYTQAPDNAKSLIMAMYLGSVALGNLFVSVVNLVIQNPDGSNKLEGAAYFWFFAAIMLVVALLFIIVARWFKVRELPA